jgi:hypothetical protein
MGVAALGFAFLCFLIFALWRLNPVIEPHFQRLMTPAWQYWDKKGPRYAIGGTVACLALGLAVSL